ncbi:oxygen-dependent protoporphyrinogen oxidase [Coemansia sp. RSA 1813]|nr:oxygen-dependent protoporphyrinogen oxidase [Coemansia sp. RSA 1646]KAJ1771068.1 oxygen-dependent protoporphyrinogen oxidase [Coemansia sp. RSA 1843]KAJ2214802.1 oxygen-dependent protoporphyrinogen oxidase [Coemansia sp. RSA 487]KAJ2569791.1 oxygen-dependent protoporphyrinogen oxidase [Coemansia sp. RSA 1813]
MTAAISVLGGGISGLSTAWYLSQRLPPNVKVQLIEGSSRLGGWVWSEVRQAGGASFLAEKGPRTLRTGNSREALAVLELVDDLDLRSQVVTASKLSAAARNRYIYYKGELNCMPSGLASLLTGLPPAVRCLPRGIWHDLTTRKSTTPADSADESIHNFISRRFGEDVDDNLASAVMHGIYAADTKELSARALLYPFWLADHTGETGVLRGLRRVAKLSRAYNARFSARDNRERLDNAYRRTQNPEFWESIDEASMYSFRSGMQTLTESLASKLRSRPNVEIIVGQSVSKIQLGAGGMAEVVLANGQTLSANHIVNTLPLHRIQDIFGEACSSTLVEKTPYANVAVVNVAYLAKKVEPVDGFGYLVPRASASDSKALGVVFDSCALPAQDGDADISRLTVMLGGSRFSSLFGDPDSVSNSTLEEAALETIRTQLGIKMAPADVDATLGRKCIPSYTVGYVDRLKSMHEWVKSQLNGRMSVVGAAYGGPAVPQCILHARDLVDHHLNLDALEAPQNISGLEEIIDGFDYRK